MGYQINTTKKVYTTGEKNQKKINSKTDYAFETNVRRKIYFLSYTENSFDLKRVSQTTHLRYLLPSVKRPNVRRAMWKWAAAQTPAHSAFLGEKKGMDAAAPGRSVSVTVSSCHGP